MAQATALQPTLVSVIWPSRTANNILRNVILALAGTALLTLSAKIQVPFYPVPMTMQTFMVLTLGMAYAGGIVLFFLVVAPAGLRRHAGKRDRGRLYA